MGAFAIKLLPLATRLEQQSFQDRGAALGKETEERFFAICEKFRNRLQAAGVSAVKRTTFEEDVHDGIDVNVEAKKGNMTVQIKRSEHGKRKHMNRPDRRHIPCLVVPPHRADEDILEDFIKLLAPVLR